jgi:hypothetical protein
MGAAAADTLRGDPDATRAAPLDPSLLQRCGVDLGIGAAVSTKILESIRSEVQGILETA